MTTALITGANRSIGLETARQLARQGYFVYMGSRDLAKGSEATAQLKAEGLATVEALQLDVSDPASIKAARARVPVLDVLVNNAGISGGFPQPPSGTTSALAREVFNTNVFGAMDMVTTFLDLLKQSPAPRIVNVTSGLASLTLHSDPRWKYYAIKGGVYGPSKSALNAYTVALAWELRDTPVKVNAVDPGYTATEFNHFNGPGSVEDAAAIIVKYATIGKDGPTGRFFSNDIQDKGESPW